MTSEGYDPTKSKPVERIQGYRGLGTRYNSEGAPPSGPIHWDSIQKDTGNNAYMGIAFARFVRRYASFYDHEDVTRYARAAADIFLTVHQNLRCPYAYEGYSARYNGQNYTSTEHNIDMYALATHLLEVFTGNVQIKIDAIEKNYILEAARQGLAISYAYVNQMFDSNGYFLIGCGFCTPDQKQNTFQPTPVDVQTWSLLAGADYTASRQASALDWAVKNTLSLDSTRWADGCDTHNCSAADNDVYTGFKFTTAGVGIQLENTGSSTIAVLELISRYNSSREALGPVAANLTSSLKRLWKVRGYEGMWASLRPKGGATGLGWDYGKVPHTASSVYTASALAYVKDKAFNPYSTAVSQHSLAMRSYRKRVAKS
ncbi:hypothetical protein CYMTET_36947 [Cymbomonas tetramitiformis]|uniref:Uncharacterized protein n=1 Tax=Cymbomonas tetramitiformis TaxID=36881 RepID=A0AAE0CGD5_9CHLO|nr:hypothetical protein CYMTET_36947 [Cymbomonas tetramitiformis]